MVGEIRDPETAEIAVQSALTGHLVYTTVHANNAIDVLGRFQHMGVDTYNLVSALNGVLAQRLVQSVLHGLQRQRLRQLPGHRLQGPQSDRRAAGAERRAARADHRARAGAQAEGSRRAPPARCRSGRPRCGWCTPAKQHSRRSIVSLLWRNKTACASGSAPDSHPASRSERATPSRVQGDRRRRRGAPRSPRCPRRSPTSQRRSSVVLADQFVRYALLP